MMAPSPRQAQHTQPVRAVHGAEWAQRPERSNLLALRVMCWLSLHLGRRASRLVLHLIGAYFLLFGPAARRASRDYLARVLGRPPRLAEQYAHFLSFASTIHDRVYLLNGRYDLFDVTIQGEAHLRAAIDAGAGAFLLGAHLGSFEVLRAHSRRQPGLRVALVMYEENARKINAALAAINPAAEQDIIALGHAEAMVRVRDRLDEGCFVGILGDRSLGDEPMQRVELLGAPAMLPIGPMRLAATLRRPVMFMAGLYLGANRYMLHFEPLADFSATEAAGRDAAIARAIDAYAACIERLCRAAPYNWFNFHDFWHAR